MQDDSGMSEYPLLTSCRRHAVSRMMKTDVVCGADGGDRVS